MSYKKEEENNTEPKGTLKIFMPSKRQQKPWGRVKLVGKLEGDQGVHSQGWTTKPAKADLEEKWLKVKGTREARLKM